MGARIIYVFLFSGGSRNPTNVIQTQDKTVGVGDLDDPCAKHPLGFFGRFSSYVVISRATHLGS